MQKHEGLLLFPGGFFKIWQIIIIIVVPVEIANHLHYIKYIHK